MNLAVNLEVIDFKGTEEEMLDYINKSSFNEACKQYTEAVMERCSRGLSPTELNLFHDYMNGKIASDHPEIERDRLGSRRVADSVLEAISLGLG